MIFNQSLQKEEELTTSLNSKFNNLSNFLEIYSDYLTNPIPTLKTILSDPLTSDLSIFRDEISLAIKQDFTYDIAYKKGLKTLAERGNDIIKDIKSEITKYNQSGTMNTIYSYINDLYNTLEVKHLFDRKEEISRAANREAFFKKMKTSLVSLFRGDLLNGREVNEVLVNYDTFLKDLFNNNMNNQTMINYIDNVKSTFDNFLTSDNQEDELRTKVIPLLTTKYEPPETDVDSIVRILISAKTNKPTNITDSPEEVMMKYLQLVNGLVLKFKDIDPKVIKLMFYNIEAFSFSFNKFKSVTDLNLDKINLYFQQQNAELTYKNTKDILDNTKAVVQGMHILNQYFLYGTYYIKAEFDLFVFIFKLIYKLTLETASDMAVANSKR